MGQIGTKSIGIVSNLKSLVSPVPTCCINMLLEFIAWTHFAVALAVAGLAISGKTQFVIVNKCQANGKTLGRAYLSSDCFCFFYSQKCHLKELKQAFSFDIHDTQTVSKGSAGLRVREELQLNG